MLRSGARAAHLALLLLVHARTVHIRVQASIHNPDSDDSFYPFANQWYMSRKKGENRKKRGKKKHTSCWSVNRTGAELSSPFHTPLQPSRHNKVPNP